MIDCAVLVGLGVTVTGHQRVLGVSVALSEAEVHWRDFLDSLNKRGLSGVNYILSDDHAGLRAARKATFASVPWQRCQFHLQQNAQKYVARSDEREAVSRLIQACFNAPNRDEATRLLNPAVASWQTHNPKLAAWAETNLQRASRASAYPRLTGYACAPPMALSGSTKRLNVAPVWLAYSRIPRAACASFQRCSASRTRTGSRQKSICR